MISLDTETQGVDFAHGAQPFCVTIGNEDGTVDNYTWDVDPETREVLYDLEDLAEIRERLQVEQLVFQNAKFDVKALATIGVEAAHWDWIDDTLVAGHLLSSSTPHDLTSMTQVYLGVNIQPLEDVLEQCVQACRRLARSRYPSWKISKKGLACMPSASEETWRFDYWLPKAIAVAEGLPLPDAGCKHQWSYQNPLCTQCRGHLYWDVTKQYSNADAAVTLPLWGIQRDEIRRRGLWDYYQDGLKVQRVLYGMERYGVSFKMDRLNELSTRYLEGSEEAEQTCKGIAASYGFELQVPKGGVNKSLQEFCFGKVEEVEGKEVHTNYINYPVTVLTEKGKPSLNKVAMEDWLAHFPKTSREYQFISTLRGKRMRDTACSFMESYRKFGIDEGEGWYRMYPGINQTATATLRMSSYNPNGQQISKKEIDENEDYTLRYIFGPKPGRVWYAMDYENIELKIPAYMSGEKKMIELFEKPDVGPYYGSYHLLNASLIYPDLFWPIANKMGEFKKLYASTWYQWCKNTGFAIQYGCQKAKADTTAHKVGAFELLNQGLPKVTELKQKVMKFAEKNGFIETIPVKGRKRGYPLLCQRTEWGKIQPTIPFSYYVQGSAMDCSRRALVRCDNQLNEWHRKDKYYDGHIVLSPHDEIVFDLPDHELTPERVKILKGLMEKSGEDIDIPLTVSVTHCPVSWS